MNGTPDIQPLKFSEMAQMMIFKEIWTRMPRRSFVSGLWLRTYENTPLFPNCFMHVLYGDKYKYFKYYFGNIILVTPAERALYLQCTPESLIQYALSIEEKSRGTATARWDAVRALEEDLKKQYVKSFPSTRGMFLNYSYTIEDQARIIGKLNSDFWLGFKK